MWVDLVGGDTPHVKIQRRPEYKFIPKKYHCRNVNIGDQELWAQLMRTEDGEQVRPRVPHQVRHAQHALLDDTQALFKKAKLTTEKGHPHCWRATYCTTLMRQGVPIQDIMSLMGHKDMATTMRYLAILEQGETSRRCGSGEVQSRLIFFLVVEGGLGHEHFVEAISGRC